MEEVAFIDRNRKAADDLSRKFYRTGVISRDLFCIHRINKSTSVGTMASQDSSSDVQVLDITSGHAVPVPAVSDYYSDLSSITDLPTIDDSSSNTSVSENDTSIGSFIVHDSEMDSSSDESESSSDSDSSTMDISASEEEEESIMDYQEIVEATYAKSLIGHAIHVIEDEVCYTARIVAF